MLTEKDYCDYETCVALKELGYKVPTSAYYMPNYNQLIFVSNPCRGGYVIDCFRSHNSFPKDVMTSTYIDAPTMWEAQKWLREEHQIHIMVDRFGQDYMWCIKEKGAIDITHQEYEDYVNYESALLGGIKYAIKLLKGE